MRRTTRHAAGGFAAGVLGTIAAVSMLGMRQQPTDYQTMCRKIETFQREMEQAEDQRAEADTQVLFWQREMSTQDSEVARLQSDPGMNPCVPFFLDRVKGLAGRAANSYLDARLHQALCFRKVQALKSVAVGQ